ncbi:MAG: HNH endonuclease [Ramlibacter sp.]|nr:HNH endonuclease [Ramlibacter sp.]
MLKVPRGATLRDKQQANGRTLALNGAAWGRLRRFVLSSAPLCSHCIERGLTTVATDVDHRDNNPSNNDLTNLVPLCHECHSRKTARDMGKRVATGCNTEGMPLDPAHPWNAGTVARLMEKSPATDGAEPTRSTHAHRRT